MKTVTMDRLQLIDILKTNLEKHLEEFEIAKQGYVIQQEDALKKALTYFRKNGKLYSDEYGQRTGVLLPIPMSQEGVYRQAIELLEHSIEPTQVLDLQEFEQLVRDNWNWSNQFKNLSANYGASVAGARR